MSPTKITKRIFPVLLIACLLAGGIFIKTKAQTIKGDGVTFSEYFHPYDVLNVREHVRYYDLAASDEVTSPLYEQMKNAINQIGTDRLPFELKKETGYLVTSTTKYGERLNQVQMGFFNQDDARRGDFFIISATESDRNPLEGVTINDNLDTVGNELKKVELLKGVPMYQQILTTNSALLYRYYDLDETENQIRVVGTQANEFYAYYDGYIYHIGYSIDREKNDSDMQEKMLNLVREYMLVISE